MNIRGDRADDVAHGALVKRIAIRMEQADREGLDALRQKIPDLLLNLRPVQRTLNRSVGENSLFDRPAPPTRNQRRRLFQIEIIKIEPMLGSDFDRVTKTLGDEQGRSRAAPLNHGIRHQRRAVVHALHGLQIDVVAVVPATEVRR